jgi:hypothetical protein
MSFRLKGLSPKAKNFHTELVQVLGSDAIASSTVTKPIRNNVILQNEPEAEGRAEDQGSRLQTMQFWKHLK